MGIQAQPFTHLNAPLINCFLRAPSNSRFFSRKPLFSNPLLAAMRAWKWNGSPFVGIYRMNLAPWRMKNQTIIFAAAQEPNGNTGIGKKRKVVEHVCLIKAKDELSDEQEKDMLDYLYTTQYHMRGVVALSLGRVSNQGHAKYTHAVYMRFQKKEDLTKFYDNPFYVGVLRDRVFPYCHNIVNVDYESEVENDILPIFRKGEEFNYGVEFVLVIAFKKNSLGVPAEEAMTALAKLTTELPSLIVQATKGSSMNIKNAEYTHAAVIRFRSSEAFEIFMKSSEYNNIWESKLQPITEKAISVHFSVDPIGTELM